VVVVEAVADVVVALELEEVAEVAVVVSCAMIGIRTSPPKPLQ
jgi:hypothetical protein